MDDLIIILLQVYAVAYSYHFEINNGSYRVPFLKLCTTVYNVIYGEFTLKFMLLIMRKSQPMNKESRHSYMQGCSNPYSYFQLALRSYISMP